MKKLLIEKIKEFNFLEEYRKMSFEEKENFEKKFLSFDLKKLEKQKNSFLQKKKEMNFEPLKKADYYSLNYFKTGEEALRKGLVAFVVLAGGMASRLKWDHPKGCFEVTNIKKKSLFQLMSEKVLAAEKRYETRLEIAVMTAQSNNEETISFFEKNNFFGLQKDQLHFFIQEELPVLDENGKWIFFDGEIFSSPDGNGGVFENLKKSAVFEKFKNRGIKYLNIAPIDNPLFDPFDAVFVGYHLIQKNEVSFIAIEKDGEESMGAVGLNNKKIHIVEYVHLNSEEKKKFKFFNTSLFCISLDFIEKNKFDLPLHHVKKSFKNSQKEFIGFKSEMFIFDILQYAADAGVICYPQNLCYSPLKNYSGKDSLKSVQDALYQKDRIVFKEITKRDVPDIIFELSPSFYYPEDQLKQKWMNQKLPNTLYVES